MNGIYWFCLRVQQLNCSPNAGHAPRKMVWSNGLMRSPTYAVPSIFRNNCNSLERTSVHGNWGRGRETRRFHGGHTRKSTLNQEIRTDEPVVAKSRVSVFDIGHPETHPGTSQMTTLSLAPGGYTNRLRYANLRSSQFSDCSQNRVVLDRISVSNLEEHARQSTTTKKKFQLLLLKCRNPQPP